jgi:Spy/CpxP family protein refolding chaperone
MKHLIAAVLSTALLGTGIGLTGPALADEHGMHGMGEMHGKGHGMYSHHGGGGWKASLTDEQSKQIDKLRLDYKQKAYLLKARIKQAKIELAMLITTDSPKQKDIDKKIDEILKLKGEKMRLKAAHKISVRKLLTEEQRVQFDLHVLNKAYDGKQGKGHHR